jgi:outer membrane protein TolC
LATPADRLYASLIDPAHGLAKSEDVLLELDSILALAARNSRELQNAKESLHLTALDYLAEEERYGFIPTLSGGATRSDSSTGDSLELGGDFGISKLLEHGAELGAGFALTGLNVTGSGLTTDSVLSLTAALPLLRNSRLNAADERLTQADRDVLYAWRTFERFKQRLAVDVVSSYLLALSSSRRLANEEANVASLVKARERNESLFSEGRISIVEVGQARQQVFTGENRLVLARQNVERTLDDLKQLLGLPVDVRLKLRLEDLDALGGDIQDAWRPAEQVALKAGLRNRLDLRNSVDAMSDALRRQLLAEDVLRPALDLSAAYNLPSAAGKPLRFDGSSDTWSLGLNLDFALDSHAESFALRGSDIALMRAQRTQEELAETVKLEVRDALRRLDSAASNWRIAGEAVKLAEQRAASTRELMEEDRAITRDYLESQEALIRSQNDHVDAAVEFRIAWLRLFRDTGTLSVSPEGLDHELARHLFVDE